MDEDELALVSSLYGRGTILCWLLTILACLISWTCDKEKRRSDTLNADFIGILTLPSVAAGHTLYQIRCLKTLSYSDMRPVKITQFSRAIEASLTIIETFITFSIVLFLLVFLARCYKRAVSIALTGLFCLATEYLVYSQLTSSPNQDLRAITTNFTRSFVSNSGVIIGVIPILVVACIAITLSLALYVFYITLPRHLEPISEETAAFARTMREREILHTPEAFVQRRSRKQMRHVLRDMSLSVGIAAILVTSSYTATNASIYMGVHSLSAGMTKSSDWWSGLGYAVQRRFLAAFFPKTVTGLGDLDQAVALAGGCVILSLSLWSVGSNLYSKWRLEHEARLRRQRREDIRLTELRQQVIAFTQEAQ